MKIKNGFILREMSGDEQGTYIVVAVGEASKNLSGYLTLNETGAFLWKELVKGCDEDALLAALLAEYDVEEEIAKTDVKAFITKLTEAGLIK